MNNQVSFKELSGSNLDDQLNALTKQGYTVLNLYPLAESIMVAYMQINTQGGVSNGQAGTVAKSN